MGKVNKSGNATPSASNKPNKKSSTIKKCKSTFLNYKKPASKSNKAPTFKYKRFKGIMAAAFSPMSPDGTKIITEDF